MMHKLSEAPLMRSKHDIFSYAIMLCDPNHIDTRTAICDRCEKRVPYMGRVVPD